MLYKADQNLSKTIIWRIILVEVIKIFNWKCIYKLILGQTAQYV